MKVMRIGITLLVLSKVPIVFIGFSQHHDGLMLSTVRNLSQAFHQNGAWPFNQYGPFWIFPYYFFSELFPPTYALLSMRALTLAIYGATLVLIWKIGRVYSSAYVSEIAIFLILVSHPTGLEPIPWPSSMTFLLQVLIVWIMLVKMIDSRKSWPALALGIITSACLFSRVQVGLLFFFLVFISLFIKSKYNCFFYFIGFSFSTVLFLELLNVRGWLKDALRDQFAFGASSVLEKGSPHPVPTFAIGIAILITAIVFFCHYKRSLVLAVVAKFDNPACRLFSVLFLFILFISMIIFPRLLQVQQHLFGRFWTGLMIFFLVYTLSFTARKTSKREFVYHDFVLLFAAMIALSQAYPLFDIMHIWWGGNLAFLVLGISLFQYKNKFVSVAYLKRGFVGYFIFAPLLVLGVAPGVAAIIHAHSSLPQSSMSATFLDGRGSGVIKSEQIYFDKVFRKNEKVLNICSDAQIFFKPNFVIPAAREFVVWPLMNELKSYRSDLIQSNPDVIFIWLTPTNEKLDHQNQILREIQGKNPRYSLADRNESLHFEVWRKISG